MSRNKTEGFFQGVSSGVLFRAEVRMHGRSLRSFPLHPTNRKQRKAEQMYGGYRTKET